MYFSPKQEEENSSVVHAHAVNGIFRIAKDNIEFEATSIKCFQVAVAFRLNGVFRLKYAFTAQKNGIICQSVQESLVNREGLYQIPSDFDLNTALIIGIVPSSAVVNFRTHGNGIDENITWRLEELAPIQENVIDGIDSGANNSVNIPEIEKSADDHELPPTQDHVIDGIDSGTNNSVNVPEMEKSAEDNDKFFSIAIMDWLIEASLEL